MNGAVIFDLDGTLTVPILDFDLIRREIGIVGRQPILEALQAMDAGARVWAWGVVERHESLAAEQSVLRRGAVETVRTIRAAGIPVAILTRNAFKWTDIILRRHSIEVDAVRSRDDGVIKPSAVPVIELCQRLERSPTDSLMVGDHLIDIESGQGAGCRTVLIVGEGETPEYAGQADHVIRELPELIALLGL
jgi:HAD superfamily hydrolase (TIGR01549 family)